MELLYHIFGNIPWNLALNHTPYLIGLVPLSLGTWNDDHWTPILSGWWWLEPWNFMTFHILGMSSSQLLLTPSFFRGVAKNHQPAIKWGEFGVNPWFPVLVDKYFQPNWRTHIFQRGWNHQNPIFSCTNHGCSLRSANKSWGAFLAGDRFMLAIRSIT